MFNPSFPIYQVNRGDAPPPGAVPPAATPQKKMIRILRDGRWYYYDPGTFQDRFGPSANGEPVTVDAVVTDGYSHEATPAAPATPPAQPAAPVPAGPPTLVTQPTEISQQGGANVQAGQQPGLQGNGPWVRISNAGNVLGEHIVRADSPLAQQAQASGIRPQPVLVGLKTTPVIAGVPPAQIPDELSTAPNFDAAYRYISQASGGQARIIAYESVGVQGENSGQQVAGHKVVFRLPNGAEQTYTFRQQGDDMVVVGAPETNLSGVTTPEKANLEKAQAAYQAAAAEKIRLESQQIPGQVESQELKNAKERADAAERAFNTAMGLGNRTHAEALDDRKTEAGIALTQAQTGAVAVQNNVAQAGAQNQTYQNVLQYFRDQGFDEAKSVELTLQYFNNRANVDNSNNTLAVSAARAQVDAQTSANTQRVSLANNRLNASNTGFSDDAKTAMDLNQYLKPGSEKGAEALMALQAMRYANARKYGAFDVNDTDLRYDESKLPSGIRAFANPSAPSFTAYPSWDEMNAASNGMRSRLQPNGERPTPPGFTPITPTGPSSTTPRTAAAPPPGAARTPPGTPPPPNPYKPGPPSTPPNPVAAPTEVTTNTTDPLSNAGIGARLAPPGGFRTMDPATEPLSPSAAAAASAATQSAQPVERDDDIITYLIPGRDPNDPSSYAHYYRIQVVKPEFQQELATNGLQLVTAQGREAFNAQYPEGDPRRWGPIPETPYNPKPGEPGHEPGKPLGQIQFTPEAIASASRRTETPEGFGPEQYGHTTDNPLSESYGVRPVAPYAVTQLTEPSQATMQANALLAQEEEERKRRNQAFMAQWGSPQAIYGLFEGEYPNPATFI